MKIATAKRIVGGIAVAVTISLLAACSGAGAPEKTLTPTTTESSAASAEIPNTPIGERATWVMEILNSPTDTTEADWVSIVAPTMGDGVPQIVKAINEQIRPAAPWTVKAYDGTDREATVRITSAAGAVDLQLSIDEQDLITGILFTPAATIDPAKSLDEVEDRLDDFDFDVNYLVTRTSNGKTETLLKSDEDESAPLGSIFKLYVLLAVHEAVAAGKLTWDDPLTITADVKSLPSGELQNQPDGTQVTVREAANKMISISDNTATDMLIAAVGRENVEAAVKTAGHHDPSELTPFLTTREMFQLSWGVGDDVRTQWESASTEERRSILETIGAQPLNITEADIKREPYWKQGVEWFASAEDIAKVHTALAEAEDQGVTEALTINPGVPIDPKVYPSVAFKGGSNSAVVTGSWRAEMADGTVVTVVMLGSGDDATKVDEDTANLLSLASDIFALAAK